MDKKIIVIKIGSSVFVTRRRRIDEFRVCKLVDEIALLQQQGWKVIVVVSGAVALGMRAFDYLNTDNTQKRCAAGVGQLMVMNEFYRRFLSKNIHCAQLLLTKDAVVSADRKTFLAAQIRLYLKTGIIPIINENDVVDLYAFGGNDVLAFAIAELIQANNIMILSSYISHFGFGGTSSKTAVIKKAQRAGIRALIADGKKPWIHFLRN